MWLEGDDPACNDDAIGGHLGVEMNFTLDTSNTDTSSDGNSGDDDNSFGSKWRKFWDSVWSGLSD
jgi:hypothetical protein